MLHVECPRCAKRLALPDGSAGAVGQCPACSQRFRVPKSAHPPASSPEEEMLDVLPGGEEEEILDAEVDEDQLEVVGGKPRKRKKQRRKRDLQFRTPVYIRERDGNTGITDALALGGVIVLAVIVLIMGVYVASSLWGAPWQALAILTPAFLGFSFAAVRFFLRRML